MSPDLVTLGLVRSVEVVNEDIRAFWTAPGAHPSVPLTPVQRAAYMRLVAEYEEARRAKAA